jgi:hypothetical protein
VRTPWFAAAVAGAATALLLGACGGTHDSAGPSASASPSAQASTTPSATNPYGAGPIDPPAPNEPVLTVKGGQTPLSLTIDQLNALGDTTVTLDEPFVKKRQTFSGVPLATVMAKAGIPNTATVETVALNDYHYASPVGPMVDSLALLATKRDGQPIPYDQGGPVRIVFPDGTPLSSNLDAWNWSLASIAVTRPGAPGS